ncbi:tetratricopeptide repeat protein 27-like [Varroa jacobsoni]|uniref:tetratricopeptide repeat protein 27-like n=1 Tax=Varroa jacobsoni TaxID=62625 RepID=UPI000BF70019|nr:tetratricopeptide repeat protein 27-like [Varroa jacobsoni]
MCKPVKTIQPEEICLLCLHEERSTANEEFNTVVSLLREGKFQQLFQLPWFSIFRHDNLQGFSKQLQEIIPKLENAAVRLLSSAVAFLFYFIQQNFIGPINTEEITSTLFPSSKQVSCLSIDGEDAYHLVKAPVELFIARVILVEFAAKLRLATFHVWRQRYAVIHQRILSERVGSLQEIVKESTTELEKSTFENYPELWTEIRLESAMANLEFFQIATTEELLMNASERMGLKAELGGALGTRTHFQTNSIAQLVLKIQRTKPLDKPISTTSYAENNLPIDVALQDDTVMDRTKFDEEQNDCTLSCSEQALILAMSMLKKRLNAPEELLDEEVMVYLDRVLSQPKLWTIQFSALFQRSVLECMKSRKVERALSQYQTLVNSVSNGSPAFGLRSHMFFLLKFPTTWKLERSLANGYISLGLTKSALDIYLRLELWEEVVECYQRLQRNDRAKAIITKLLQDEETPYLYCLLGDVTGDPLNYQMAWKLSGERNARAKRSWGSYHFQRKEYEYAIPQFEESLELNRLHQRTWQQLAFAYMETGRFEKCVQAYKHVVNIDSDNFEAWNNMAKAYISLGEKKKAYKVLQESIKCNYEDWRIWENYLLVSMDVGAFDEVIKSWHRLIDIKQKHSDPKIAHLLVQVVKEDIKDFDGKPASAYLRPKLFELFGRATTGVTNDAELWAAYGDLYFESKPREGMSWSDHAHKMVSCYQKSLRCYTQKENWDKDANTTLQIIGNCHNVWSQLQKLASRVSTEEKRRLEESLRMTIRNIITMAKRGIDYYLEDQQDSIAQRTEELEYLIKP